MGGSIATSDRRSAAAMTARCVYSAPTRVGGKRQCVIVDCASPALTPYRPDRIEHNRECDATDYAASSRD